MASRDTRKRRRIEENDEEYVPTVSSPPPRKKKQAKKHSPRGNKDQFFSCLQKGFILKGQRCSVKPRLTKGCNVTIHMYVDETNKIAPVGDACAKSNSSLINVVYSDWLPATKIHKNAEGWKSSPHGRHSIFEILVFSYQHKTYPAMTIDVPLHNIESSQLDLQDWTPLLIQTTQQHEQYANVVLDAFFQEEEEVESGNVHEDTIGPDVHLLQQFNIITDISPPSEFEVACAAQRAQIQQQKEEEEKQLKQQKEEELRQQTELLNLPMFSMLRPEPEPEPEVHVDSVESSDLDDDIANKLFQELMFPIEDSIYMEEYNDFDFLPLSVPVV